MIYWDPGLFVYGYMSIVILAPFIEGSVFSLLYILGILLTLRYLWPCSVSQDLLFYFIRLWTIFYITEQCCFYYHGSVGIFWSCITISSSGLFLLRIPLVTGRLLGFDVDFSTFSSFLWDIIGTMWVFHLNLAIHTMLILNPWEWMVFPFIVAIRLLSHF